MSLALDGFPGPELFASSPKAHRARVSEWQDEASGRRLRTGIQVDDSLRRFVREHAQDRVGRALLSSRRAVRHHGPRARRRRRPPRHARRQGPGRPARARRRGPRPRSTSRRWARHGAAVGRPRRPRGAVDARRRGSWSRGSEQPSTRPSVRADRRTIVHHGFYFYSPVQWAFFQALARVPDVDQVFIVHDDGDNPAFSTWRYFFRTEWKMPIARPGPGRPRGHARPRRPSATC